MCEADKKGIERARNVMSVCIIFQRACRMMTTSVIWGFLSYCPFFRVFPLASGFDHMTTVTGWQGAEEKKLKKISIIIQLIIQFGPPDLVNCIFHEPPFFPLSPLLFYPFILLENKRRKIWITDGQTADGKGRDSCIYERMYDDISNEAWNTSNYVSTYLKWNGHAYLYYPTWSPKR